MLTFVFHSYDRESTFLADWQQRVMASAEQRESWVASIPTDTMREQWALDISTSREVRSKLHTQCFKVES